MKEAANRGGLVTNAKNLGLPGRPTATVPVAAAFVLAPAVMLVPAPAPVILMDNNAGVRRILMALAGVPADAARADDRCRGAHSRHGQNGSTCRRRQKGFAQES